MAFHHVAVATRDLEASHRFYTEAMGFELVRVEVVPSGRDGWARHVFYETGDGQLFALWDLHVAGLDDYETGISTGLGLPHWVNHIAFAARDLAELEGHRERLLAHGHDVARVDHGWCTSIYANDPNGVMVEFCTTTRVFTEEDRAAARALLAAERPSPSPEAPIELFPASRHDTIPS